MKDIRTIIIRGYFIISAILTILLFINIKSYNVSKTLLLILMGLTIILGFIMGIYEYLYYKEEKEKLKNDI